MKMQNEKAVIKILELAVIKILEFFFLGKVVGYANC
jgi:hypothetical protein